MNIEIHDEIIHTNFDDALKFFLYFFILINLYILNLIF